MSDERDFDNDGQAQQSRPMESEQEPRSAEEQVREAQINDEAGEQDAEPTEGMDAWPDDMPDGPDREENR